MSIYLFSPLDLSCYLYFPEPGISSIFELFQAHFNLNRILMVYLRILLFLFLLLPTGTAMAQTNWPHQLPWSTPTDSCFAYDVEELSNGDFIVAGQVVENNQDTAYIARLNPFGAVIWHHRLPANSLQRIEELPDKGFICTSFSPHGFRKKWNLGDRANDIMRLDSNGQVIWQYHIDPPVDHHEFDFVWRDNQTGVFAMEKTIPPLPGDSINEYEFHLISIDQNGNVLIDSLFPQIYSYDQVSLAATANGDVVMAYRPYFTGFMHDIACARFTNHLAPVWIRQYSLPFIPQGSNQDIPIVKETPFGELEIFRVQSRSFQLQETGLQLLRLNQQGDSLAYFDMAPSNGHYHAGEFLPLPDGGHLIGGQYRPTINDDWEGFLARLDQQHNWIWTTPLIAKQTQHNVYDIEATSDGGFAVASTPGLGPS